MQVSRQRRSSWLLPTLLLALAASAPAQVVFEPPLPTTLTHKTQGVRSADVNLDGHADLLTMPQFETGFIQPHVSVLLGNGEGSFAPPVTTTFIGVDAGRAAVALVNGDAWPDLVVVQNISGDQLLSLCFGAGDGTFPTKQYVSVPLGANVVDVVPVDVTGDGRLDFVMLNASAYPFNLGRIIVAVDDGAGGYTIVNGPGLKFDSNHFALGDVNDDGVLDAVVTSTSAGTLTVELGTGGGNFAAPVHTIVGGVPNGVLLRDLDGDGEQDVVYADTSGNRVVSMRGDGTGQFALLQSVDVPGGPTEISSGSLDSDGVLDLLVSDTDSGELTVLRGAGDGTFTAVTTVSHVAAAGGSALADFDEDGVVDAAVGGDTLLGTVSVLRNHTYAAGSPFTDLGHALAGSNGYPILLASGGLAAGEAGSLHLKLATPGAGGNLWLGLGQLNKPFKGGVFVPLPLLPIPFVADAGGHVGLPYVFPAGVPAGTTLVFQFWIGDAGAVKGFAASSGLLGVTP